MPCVGIKDGYEIKRTQLGHPEVSGEDPQGSLAAPGRCTQGCFHGRSHTIIHESIFTFWRITASWRRFCSDRSECLRFGTQVDICRTIPATSNPHGYLARQGDSVDSLHGGLK